MIATSCSRELQEIVCCHILLTRAARDHTIAALVSRMWPHPAHESCKRSLAALVSRMYNCHILLTRAAKDLAALVSRRVAIIRSLAALVSRMWQTGDDLLSHGRISTQDRRRGIGFTDDEYSTCIDDLFLETLCLVCDGSPLVAPVRMLK